MTKENKSKNGKHHLALYLDETKEEAKRSNTFTVYIEGTTDFFVYRSAERLFKEKNSTELAGQSIDFVPIQGRPNLFEYFDNLKNNNDCCFLADQDKYCYRHIPEKYIHPKLIFTAGYCIENELFTDGFEDLYKRIFEQEKQILNSLLNQSALYFAYVCEDYNADCEVNNQEESKKNLSLQSPFLNPEEFDMKELCFTKAFLERNKFKIPKQATIEKMKQNHFSKVQGKWLFQALHIIYKTRKEKDKTKNIIRTMEVLFDDCLHSSSPSAHCMSDIFQKILAIIKNKNNQL